MAASVLKMPDHVAEHKGEQLLAQATWSATTISSRLRVLRKARHSLASMSSALVDAIPTTLSRTRADTYAAEVLPLLAACKFLEQEAEHLLNARRLGSGGLPFWLAGTDTKVERVPFGVVLVIGPANYPLFLPGVQTLQALAAGNAVVWKPGRGGRPVAEKFLSALEAAGLPEGLLRVTDDAVQTAIREIGQRPDKIFFTGSSQAGRKVLQLAAETATPVVVELSGCDLVVALESTQPQRLVQALQFGMRLNGSATCMAPRRLILVGQGHESLIDRLKSEFAAMHGVPVDERERLRALLLEARVAGATVLGNLDDEMIKPILVLNASPAMAIAQADIFAPVLTVIHARNVAEAGSLDEACPFALTAAIFGNESEALRLGATLRVGTVLINDLIVPTADPRVAFGGRRGSGFGVTRGREGLLEMTAVKTTAVRKSKSVRHYQRTGPGHEELFHAVVTMSHSGGLRHRWQGFRKLIRAAMRLRSVEEKS